VIEAKVEGRETVETIEPDTGGKLIDLMAALEASVKAAASARDAGSPAPVSVAEAKEAKAARGARAKKTAEAETSDEAAATVARPPRKRKTA